jgi:hypothetical protein
MSHELIRNTQKWGSYGINGDEPLTERLIKDLSDTHLSNIITFLTANYQLNKLKHVFEDEVTYRVMCNISVPDYVNLKTFKFK